MAHHSDDENSWSPGELEPEWLAALQGLPNVFGLASHHEQSIFQRLARDYPMHFVTLFASYQAIDGAQDQEPHPDRPLPLTLLDATRTLPPEARNDLIQRLGTNPTDRWLIISHIIGTDADWLAQAIDNAIITLDEAIMGCGNLDLRPPMADLARVLVPRGAEPDAVASIAMFGTRIGSESDHYSKIAERFRSDAQSRDRHIAVVGRAGVRIFTALAADASKTEHSRRILGYQ